MRRFYANHPHWAGSPPLPVDFHYKWYFAFHQVGDESVADRVRTYRTGLEKRDAAARMLGWVLPSVGVQAIVTRLAQTDLAAQLVLDDLDLPARVQQAEAELVAHGGIFAQQRFLVGAEALVDVEQRPLLIGRECDVGFDGLGHASEHERCGRRAHMAD